MTTEALYGPLSPQPAFTATPPQNCLNGCQRPQDGLMTPVPCETGQQLCTPCTARLDGWLRSIPDAYALLPSVVDHGTVPADPGTKHTKRPDPPAPMRAEVTDLLDTRPGLQYHDDGTPIVSDNLRGVLGILHSWAEVVRDERHLLVYCCCDHARPTHDREHCTAQGCNCRAYKRVPPVVAAECSVLLTNLTWCAGQDFAADLYDELRRLNRTLTDTVGDYRPKPVGKCAALQDRPGAPLPVLCGGALVMDREGTGVHCLACGQRHEANEGLRELGLIVGRLIKDDGKQLGEAS